MTIDSLKLWRGVLLRSFAVGAAIYILSVVTTFGAWDTWVQLSSQWYHTDEASLSRLVLNFFVITKFFLTFVLLTPGLAIHWTIKAEQSRKA
jgi:hypothetical protein